MMVAGAGYDAGVLAAVAGAPLAMLVLYVKGLREQLRAARAEAGARAAIVESTMERLRDEVTEVRRDYATKEEWLRESMWARGRIEQMAALVTELQADARWEPRVRGAGGKERE
ncbi:MAG: hypothetical protein H6816_05300 [Phycisphaerales bacterium]|nr:hypothetical protein [Phycisphaerales bacterium]